MYHPGEKRIQELAGASFQAEQLDSMVQSALTPPAVQFLLAQRLAAITTIDKDGAVSVSALVSKPGFIYPISQHKIIIDAHTLPTSDILWRNLEAETNHPAGVVAIHRLL
jgi:predicted pyridoxine 5'-phosphate oxidase superfamily flavin-nucleotide-binding protein